MKRVRGVERDWAHVSCAMWVPEVRKQLLDASHKMTDGCFFATSGRSSLLCWLLFDLFFSSFSCPSFPVVVVSLHVTPAYVTTGRDKANEHIKIYCMYIVYMGCRGEGGVPLLNFSFVFLVVGSCMCCGGVYGYFM